MLGSASPRLDQLRRDVTMIVNGWRGIRPVPFRDRRAAERVGASSGALLAPRQVRVTAVTRETPDAVSLEFELSNGGALGFVPGQFLTLILRIDGQELRRAYSLSSSALGGARATITCKRVADGRVSRYLNERIAVGDVIDVLGPSGSFTVEPSADEARHLVLIGGGSGITPLMSIARTTLEIAPRARITLLYGNRGLADVIFERALGELAATHRERFALRHVLSDPPSDWSGGTGLLDRETVTRELEQLGCSGDAHYFVCGPEPMMEAARAALIARGVPEAQIHEERFTRPAARVPGQRGAAEPVPLLVRQRGVTRQLTVMPGKTLLEAGLEAGLPMPYSCAMGGCAACKVKLVDGAVEMEEPNCLSEAERAEGWVLGCVACPTRAATIEVP